MASAGIKSNATDLAKYAQLLLAADPSDDIGTAILTSFTENHSLSDGPYNYICHGWEKTENANWTSYNRTGITYGFSSFFSLNPDDQKAVAFLVNYAPRDNSFKEMSWSFIQYFFDL